MIGFKIGCVPLDKRSEITGDHFAQQFSLWSNYGCSTKLPDSKLILVNSGG